MSQDNAQGDRRRLTVAELDALSRKVLSNADLSALRDIAMASLAESDETKPYRRPRAPSPVPTTA